jgi:hypothetical protein
MNNENVTMSDQGGLADVQDDSLDAAADTMVIGNTADVAYQIQQIHALLDAVSAFEAQKAEAEEFYDRRIEALKARADMLKENIGRWLKMNSLKKLATHHGTIFFTKRNKVIMPSDEVLEAFVNGLPVDVAKDQFYNRLLKKNELKQYILSTGIKPEGFREEPAESITIRKAA